MKVSLSATSRITIGLASLAASVVLFAQTIGLIPDQRIAIMEGRQALSEATAINCSLFASEGQLRLMKVSLQAVQERNRDVLSAGIRKDEIFHFAIGRYGATCGSPGDGIRTKVRIPENTGKG